MSGGDWVERRRHVRFTMSLPVAAKIGGRVVPALLSDLSYGGLFLRVAAPADLVGASVWLRIARRDGRRCEAAGHVVRVVRTEAVEGCGVELVQVDGALAELLDRLAELPERERSAFCADTLRPMIEIARRPTA